jgi:hypothetical protein
MARMTSWTVDKVKEGWREVGGVGWCTGGTGTGQRRLRDEAARSDVDSAAQARQPGRM